MKAIFRDVYGSPDVLQLGDVDKPEIGDDDVRLRVHAAGVGRDVWHVMAGPPYSIRLARHGLPAPQNPPLGSGVAGGVGARGATLGHIRPRRGGVWLGGG